MESMRDINRVMEREIAKGSSPLKLEHIEFGEYSYQEITSKEKIAGGVILFAADRRFQPVCRKDYSE